MGLPEICQKNIIGAEGCVWSEAIDERTIETRILPRIWAIGERTWANPAASAENANSMEGYDVWKFMIKTIRDKS